MSSHRFYMVSVVFSLLFPPVVDRLRQFKRFRSLLVCTILYLLAFADLPVLTMIAFFQNRLIMQAQKFFGFFLVCVCVWWGVGCLFSEYFLVLAALIAFITEKSPTVPYERKCTSKKTQKPLTLSIEKVRQNASSLFCKVWLSSLMNSSARR